MMKNAILAAIAALVLVFPTVVLAADATSYPVVGVPQNHNLNTNPSVQVLGIGY